MSVDVAIDADIGPPETINRLFWIADDEELAGDRMNRTPVGNGGIVCRQEHENFGLQRIGVLKLVNEDALESPLETASHIFVCHDRGCAPSEAGRENRASRPWPSRFHSVGRTREARRTSSAARSAFASTSNRGEIRLQLVAGAGDVLAREPRLCRPCRSPFGRAGTADCGQDR